MSIEVPKKTVILSQLENDVQSLKHSMEILQSLVYEQQESIDSMEDAIQLTKQDVHEAEKALVAADTYSSGYWTMYASGVVGIVLAVAVLF